MYPAVASAGCNIVSLFFADVSAVKGVVSIDVVCYSTLTFDWSVSNGET